MEVANVESDAHTLFPQCLPPCPLEPLLSLSTGRLRTIRTRGYLVPHDGSEGIWRCYRRFGGEHPQDDDHRTILRSLPKGARLIYLFLMIGLSLPEAMGGTVTCLCTPKISCSKLGRHIDVRAAPLPSLGLVAIRAKFSSEHT